MLGIAGVAALQQPEGVSSRLRRRTLALNFTVDANVDPTDPFGCSLEGFYTAAMVAYLAWLGSA